MFNVPVFDPNTTVPAGSGFARTVFANNAIPSSRFNSVGKSLADRYPDPNRPGLGANYLRTAPTSTALHTATFRGDVQLSSEDRMFGRLTLDRSYVTGQPPLPQPADTPVTQQIPSWNFGFGYTRVSGPTLVNEFRFAWSRPGISKDATAPKDEIIPGALAPGVNSSTPVFNVTGFAQLGQQPVGLTNVPLDKSSAVWEFSDNATKNMGAHLLKFGFTHQFLKFYTLTTLQGRGAFTFDGSYTQNPQARPNTGSGLADLLLGYAQTVTLSSLGISDLRAQNDLMYFQDDWKVTQRLTLNLGLRYELYWPITDTQDKLGNFVLDRSDPDLGRLVYAGLNGRSRSMMAVDRNNFAPRFGFAYRVPKTRDLTVRGGYGMFYGNPDEQTGVGAMMTNNPPFVGAGGLNLIGDRTQPSSAFNLSGRLPAQPPPIRPQDFVLVPAATATLFSWQRAYTAPVVHQWNLSFQKQLGASTVLELSYVGNSSHGLWGTHPGNQPRTPGPGGINTRRPLAAYTIAPVTVAEPWSRGHYEGAIARLERRMSRGLYFLASFTYGRAIDLSSGAGLDGCAYCGVQGAIQDAYNLAAQRGPSDSNVPRRFVFSATWDLPFGRGRQYLTSGWAAHVLGGWQTSGIWTAQDGSPFTLNLPLDNANVGQTNWPNRVCGGRLENPTVRRWFDESCFQTPPPFTLGNA
ncbi:MAG: TonB-dependent receptor, partial [Acidobacteria bacterium]|nr:TonB-dependent receptor [Acidobacteriota bacterium]